MQKCGRAEVSPTQGQSEVASLKDKEAANFRTSEGEVKEQEKCVINQFVIMIKSGIPDSGQVKLKESIISEEKERLRKLKSSVENEILR